MSNKTVVAVVASVVMTTGVMAILLFGYQSGSLAMGLMIGVPLILLALMALLRYCRPTPPLLPLPNYPSLFESTTGMPSYFMA